MKTKLVQVALLGLLALNLSFAHAEDSTVRELLAQKITQVRRRFPDFTAEQVSDLITLYVRAQTAMNFDEPLPKRKHSYLDGDHGLGGGSYHIGGGGGGHLHGDLPYAYRKRRSNPLREQALHQIAIHHPEIEEDDAEDILDIIFE